VRVTWRTATEEDVAFLTDVAVLTLQDQGRWPEEEDEAEEFPRRFGSYVLERLLGVKR